MERDQEQEKQRGFNAYESYARSKTAINLAKLVAKLSVHLGSRAAMTIAASPVGWIAIGIGIVFVATFLIVFSLGAPFSFPEEAEPTAPVTLTESAIEPKPTEFP